MAAFRLGHRPALDGVRAVAILAVLGVHDISETRIPTRGGFLGVDVFFVLSGFLITSLLYEELSDSGRIGFGRFYMRRALRLFPALALMAAAFVVWANVFGPSSTVHAANIETLATALYAQNWVVGYSHLQNVGMVHAWSLSIEEQFYIVWPLLLMLLIALGRLRLAIGFCVTGLLVVPVIRVLEWNGGSGFKPVYFSTHTRADSLLAGCLLALLLAHGIPEAADRALRRLWFPATAFVAVCLVSVLRSWAIVYSAGLTIFAVATAVVLYGVVLHGRLGRFLEHPLMGWIGRRSYGIYLWHAPILAMATYHLGHFWYGAAVGLPLTFAVSAVSYRYLEQPFLRLKRRFGRVRATAPAPEPSPVRETSPLDASPAHVATD